MAGGEIGSDELPVTEPVPAPEIYTEGYSCVGISSGVAKLQFFSVTYTKEGAAPERRVVLRLAMPLGGILGMHQALGGLIDQLRAAGTIVDKPPSGESIQ
jgi:hypothetical protein